MNSFHSIRALFLSLLFSANAAAIPALPEVSLQQIEELLQSAYAGSLGFDLPSVIGHEYELLAKAAPDECYSGLGGTYTPMTGAGCPEGSAPKVNQAYVWGLAKSGSSIWFGTMANTHCLVIGGYLGLTQPHETPDWACEFGDSQFLGGALPAQIGDWRPPRIFLYDTATGTLTDKSAQAGVLLNKTLGMRSASNLGEVVFLGGPGLGGGINLFAFNTATGALIQSKNLPAFNNIRKWIAVDGALYTAVGTAAGGAVLRWVGTPAAPFSGGTDGFEVVGNLDSAGAELALHEDRLFVTTWPGSETGAGSGGLAGLFMSPPLGDDGLTTADATGFQKVWKVDDYEPDPLIARTYGGGALASYGSYLFWGTMHVPFMATAAHLKYFGDPARIEGYPASTEESATALLGTFRAINLFRGRSFGETDQTIDLLYGSPKLPAFVYDDATKTGQWTLADNNMGGVLPKFGPPGMWNPFNNYTWTMQTFDDRLYVGTMDHSYLLYGLFGGAGQLTQYADLVPDWLLDIPYEFFGADLFAFGNPDLPALPVSLDGVANYGSYGIRTMLADDALYLGTANPMNLMTDTTDSKPEGGWELIRLSPSSQEDGDGVLPTVEDAGPNSGDANRDGVQDSLQPHVATFPNAIGTGYSTLELMDPAQCSQAALVHPALPLMPDPNYQYPYGLVGFYLPCPQATVRLWLHEAKDLTDLVYRKYLPQIGWHTLVDARFGWTRRQGKRIAYVDIDLTEDIPGLGIFDPSGPALYAPVPVPPTQPVPTLNGLALALLSLLLGAVAAAGGLARPSKRIG